MKLIFKIKYIFFIKNLKLMVNLLLILFIILKYIKTEDIINKLEFSDNINILNFQLNKNNINYFLADISKFSNENFFSIPIDYEINNNNNIIFNFEYTMITETENIQINNIKYLTELKYSFLENYKNINNLIKYHIIYKNNNQKKIIFKIKIEDLNDNNNKNLENNNNINIYIKKPTKITKINSNFNNFISEDDYKNSNKFYFINNFELKENFQYLIFTDSILGLNIIKEYIKQNEYSNNKIIYSVYNQTDNNKLEIIKNENNENDFIFRIIIEITEPLINLYIKFFNSLFINNKENDYILNYFNFNHEINIMRKKFWRIPRQPLKTFYYLNENKNNLTNNEILFLNNKILNIYGYIKNEQFTSTDLLLKYFPFSLNKKKYFNNKIINLISTRAPSLFFDLSYYNYYPLNNLSETLKENSVYYLINQEKFFPFIKNLAFNGEEVPFYFTALYNEIYENSFNVEIKINNKIITLHRNKPFARFIEKIDNNSKLFIDIFNLKILQIKIGIVNDTDVKKYVINNNIKKTYSNANTLIFQINFKKYNHFLTVFNPNLNSNFNIEFTSYPFVSSYIKNKKFFREDDFNKNINFIRIPIKGNIKKSRYFKSDKLIISTTNCKGKCYYKFEKIKNIKVNFDIDYKFIDNKVYEFEFPIFLNTVDVNIEIFYDNNNNNNFNNIFEYNLYLNNKIIKMGLININNNNYKTLLNFKFSPFNKYFLYIFDLTNGIIIFKKQNILTILERNNDIYYTGRLKDKFEMIDFNKILFTYYPLFKNIKTEYTFIFMNSKYNYDLTQENMIKLLDNNNFEENEKLEYYKISFNDYGLKNKMEKEIIIYVNESGRYKFNYIKKNSLTGYENIEYEDGFRFYFGSIKGFSKLLLLTLIICLLLIIYIIYKIITIKNKIFGKKDYSDMELTALL